MQGLTNVLQLEGEGLQLAVIQLTVSSLNGRVKKRCLLLGSVKAITYSGEVNNKLWVTWG